MAVVICKICDAVVDLDYNVEHGISNHAVDCVTCDGTGRIRRLSEYSRCRACGGEGIIEPEWF